MPLEDIRNERIKKLSRLSEAGLEAYPASVARIHRISDARKNFSKLAKAKKKIAIAGRVMARREHGGSMFLDIRDGSGKLQIYFKKDVLKDEGERNYERNYVRNYDLVLAVIDVGDFLEAEGVLFRTKKNEETLEVSGWRMLAKSLRPLPEKWHGLQDVEERFRKRYLDLLMNEEVKERFAARGRLLSFVRFFLDKAGFAEFETPLLHPVPGGALAKPFKTHHNALDIDLYLRIAPELYLKRLLVGGFEKIYELGRNFRNEGIDATHNPEFTMLECYAAWWDEEDMMKFVEKFFTSVIRKFLKKNEFDYDGRNIRVKTPFPRITFKELLRRYALITDYDAMSRDDLALKARQLGIGAERHEGKGKIADEIYKKVCRSHLANPTFVTNHPLEISPLAKKNKDGREEARRFQLIVGGLEAANGFAELNNPIDQKERFFAQERSRGGGEEEAHRLDEEFIEAMEYGMPPAAGLGLGIDRLAMLLTNVHNVKEVILFPTMRPK